MIGIDLSFEKHKFSDIDTLRDQNLKTLFKEYYVPPKDIEE